MKWNGGKKISFFLVGSIEWRYRDIMPLLSCWTLPCQQQWSRFCCQCMGCQRGIPYKEILQWVSCILEFSEVLLDIQTWMSSNYHPPKLTGWWWFRNIFQKYHKYQTVIAWVGVCHFYLWCNLWLWHYWKVLALLNY